MSYVKTTDSKVSIDASLEKVYDFVTTPSNWVGTHPVTKAVDGPNTTVSRGKGDHWIEHIKKPDVPEFQTEWTVTSCEQYKQWTIVSDPFGKSKSKIKIVYTFSQVNALVLFERIMYVDGSQDPDGALLIENMKNTAQEQQAYMTTVKKKIEAIGKATAKRQSEK